MSKCHSVHHKSAPVPLSPPQICPSATQSITNLPQCQRVTTVSCMHCPRSEPGPILCHTVQTIHTTQHLLIYSQLQFLCARGEGVQLYSIPIKRRVRIRLTMAYCREKQFAKSLTCLYNEQLVMRGAESETWLNLTPALHRWKGHVTEPYTSVSLLQGARYWALHQRHIVARDMLLSLAPALHRWKGQITEPYISVTPLDLVHQRHTSKLPSPPHISQHKSPHWYLAFRVQISDWKTDILTVFMAVSRTCRQMSQLCSSPVTKASFHMLFNSLWSNYATTRRHSVSY